MDRGTPGVEIRANSLRVAFTYEGRRHRKTMMINGKPMLPTKPNVAFCERLVKKINQKIADREFSMMEFFPDDPEAMLGEVITVSRQLDTWFNAKRAAESSKKTYQSGMLFWKETLIADKPIRILKPSEILQAWQHRPLLDGRTANGYLSVLRKALDLAMKDKLITENPAVGIDPWPHQDDPPDPFSMEEAEIILADLHGRRHEGVFNYAEFRFFTGLRSSEIAGLKWETIDFRSKTMLVKTQLVQGSERASTKTNTSRTIHLNSRAYAALMRQKVHTFLAGGNVFLNPETGTPWTIDEFRTQWRTTCRRTGIRYRRPYNTRHTFATMLLMAGMQPAYCAKQMGHSIEVFLKTYAKWMDGDHNQIEQAKLEGFLKPQTLRELK